VCACENKIVQVRTKAGKRLRRTMPVRHCSACISGRLEMKSMPEVHVFVAEGRTYEQKKTAMKEITDAVAKNFNVPPDAVIVQIFEAKNTDKSKGGIPFSER
jgi:4-oxalocrotonate tautomerase